MKKVLVKSLMLRDFRNVNANIMLNDLETSISGRNGVGKSSVQAAWNWLLSEYTDAENPKNHELYDSTKELTEETPLTRVTANIEIDGKEWTICKTAEAKFTRKRGETTYEKAASDNYVYYIDDIKTSKTDFMSWIKTNIISDPDMLVYCLDGAFFANLTKEDSKKGRKVLETIVGEVKDSELKGDYDGLIELMSAKGYTVENIMTQQKEKLNELKKDQTRISSEIEVKEKLLQEISAINFDETEKAIAEIKKQIEDIDNTLLGKAESIKPILGKRDAIFDIINSKTLKLNESRNAYNSRQISLISDIKVKISNVTKDNEYIRSRNQQQIDEKDRLKKQIENLESMLDTLNKERDRLVENKNELKEKVFTEDTCVYCGQELPYEMLEEKRKQFNDNKKKTLEIIVEKGRNVRQQIDNTEKAISEKKALLEKDVELEEYQDVDKLKAELELAEKSFVPFEETTEYKRLYNDIEDLKRSLPEIPQSDNEALTNVKKSLIEDLEIQNRIYGKKQDIIDTNESIAILQTNLRNVCNEQAVCEGLIAKGKEYIEEKANIISSKVNDKLSICKIQMYRTQKDGTLVPDCRVYSKEGVPYSTIHNSRRMLIRIELQRFFCNHFGLQLPIFVDEYKSFDDYNAPKSQNGEQMVFLYASNSNTLEIK